MKIVQFFLALLFIAVILSSGFVHPPAKQASTNNLNISFQDTVKKHSKNKSDSAHKKMTWKKHMDSTSKKADSMNKKYPG